MRGRSRRRACDPMARRWPAGSMPPHDPRQPLLLPRRFRKRPRSSEASSGMPFDPWISLPVCRASRSGFASPTASGNGNDESRAAVAIDPIMPTVSVCRSPSRLTTRIAGGFAGLDRARQTKWAWHRIDGLDCPSRPEYRMAETKPLSGAGFFRPISSSVNGAGVSRNRRFSAQSWPATMGYAREPAGMSAPQVHRV